MNIEKGYSVNDLSVATQSGGRLVLSSQPVTVSVSLAQLIKGDTGGEGPIDDFDPGDLAALFQSS